MLERGCHNVKTQDLAEGEILMGDVAGRDIARKMWMKKDAGKKQWHTSFERKKSVVIL